MSAGWKAFRIICVLQVLLTGFFILYFLFNFFSFFKFGSFAGIMLFTLMLVLAVFALNVLNKNYPDTPVAGQQKTSFNQLFLLNFFFLSFLFGFVFAEFRELRGVAILLDRSVLALPFSVLTVFVGYCIALAFQLVILYGLYQLRRNLYLNFIRKKFEFEKEIATK